ncbi:glycosyltransferase [Sulfitobacter sp. JL08]|uniref:glycosyltransferase n=1 Tax=Sulfitobacter sp. JL08 TaxID=2070369 RepID=UPI0013B3A5CA|nr:glycosyltransferase [Sulfitobacter sp. JL08]
MAGIFQRHQIEALRATGRGERIGVLSVRLRHSLPMYLKTIALRLVGKRAGNALDQVGTLTLASCLLKRLTSSHSMVSCEEIAETPVVRIEGLYLTPPSDRCDHLWWCRAGRAGFRFYVSKYGQPDIIHAHNSLPAGFLAQWIEAKYGVPYVLSEHSSYYHQGLIPSALFPAITQVLAKSSAILPVSDALTNSLETRLGTLPHPPIVIGNVIPPFFLQEVAQTNKADRVTLLTVGSLLPIKNQASLLDALAEIDGPNLRIVGDGPLLEELKARAARLGLEDRVTFLGQLDQDGVRSEMLAADALVFPSSFETFGVVLIEAMSCGLPVLAIASGGPEEIVTPKSGFLVNPGDHAGLVSAITEFMSQPDLFDSGAIRAEALARFGPDVFCTQLRETYQRALALNLQKSL